MHAQAHAGRGGPLLRCTYDPRPGFTLVHHTHDPLLLAFSREPLALGPLGGQQAAAKQLLSAFAWDEDQARATFLLPASIAEQCSSWHVTLCVPVAPDGLVAVGVSARVGSLANTPFTAADSAVSGLAASHAPSRFWRALTRHASVRLELPWLEQIVQAAERSTAPAGGATANTEAGCWRASLQVHSSSTGRVVGVAVDVLAPAPFPASEDAGIDITAVGGVLCVRVKPTKQGATRASPVWPFDPQFSMQLPVPCVPDGQPDVSKVSRKMGLLCAYFSAM